MPVTSENIERIRTASQFDAQWYLETYPDVAALKMDPAEHYLKYGILLGRDPGPEFPSQFYQRIFIGAGKTFEGGLLNLLEYVRQNGQEPATREALILSAAFDIARHGNNKLAIELANKYLPESLRYSSSILKANEALADGDRAGWLAALNMYLANFQLEPVRLSDSGDLINRLGTAPLPKRTGGPLITVIMAVWNAEKTVRMAVESVLNQTWRNIEVIIVDDASDDTTFQILKEISESDSRVRVLRNRINVGPYVSKNSALNLAKGKYITGHDGDDWAHPQRLEKQIAAMLKSRPAARASVSYMLRMRPDGKFDKFGPINEYTPDGITRRAMISAIYETDWLRNVAGYWDSVRFGGDTEMIARAQKILGEQFQIVNFPGMICLDAETNLTNDPEFGIYVSGGRMSPVRTAYKNNRTAWHDETRPENLYMSFPLKKRPFKIDSKMAVAEEDVLTNLEGHRADLLYGDREGYAGDICIVTDLAYPGGNASSTLDEINYLRGAGLNVTLIHCPANAHTNTDISRRYNFHRDLIQDHRQVSRINVDELIVRHPRVICGDAFKALSSRISTRQCHFVINNSMYRTTGELVYDPEELEAVSGLLAADHIEYCPIGPAIRKELSEKTAPDPVRQNLSGIDWCPTFDAEQYFGEPKAEMKAPYRIGRHGRDGSEKWLQDKAELLQVYPLDPDFVISILGGASKASRIVGKLPSNWEVRDYGAISPLEYLRKLDVFVYFPDKNLTEAFGRTIVEAMIAGVPCILPETFKDSFGDLCFYCKPESVVALVRELANAGSERVGFLQKVQTIAVQKFASSTIANRLDIVGIRGSVPQKIAQLSQGDIAFKEKIDEAI